MNTDIRGLSSKQKLKHEESIAQIMGEVGGRASRMKQLATDEHG